ncbi:hypothetical protein FBUS_05623 [Fasciolopsis buskii]|uniref:Integrase zinc-binding domain-containing protein n=1 Tax=Fasciolopsis buskii TaxID=27845 RepID=A0A8E0VES2_9TREM|nr:hypothetical protein FBUS_05623 [Fasciolopsis buski]
MRLVNGVLFLQNCSSYLRLIVVTPSAVDTTLYGLNNELGQPVQNGMLDAARHHFWWSHMHQDVVDYCHSCIGKILPPIRVALQSGSSDKIVQIDLMGPLLVNEAVNCYFHVMIDHLTT